MLQALKACIGNIYRVSHPFSTYHKKIKTNIIDIIQIKDQIFTYMLKCIKYHFKLILSN